MLIPEISRDVARLVRLKLYKGNIIVAGRKSWKSLYDPKIATLEGNPSTYDRSDATGFVRLKRALCKASRSNQRLRNSSSVSFACLRMLRKVPLGTSFVWIAT